MEHAHTKCNGTVIPEFIFVGFPGLIRIPELIGVTFLVTYVLTLFGNFFIFYVIKKQETLQTPMFIIICNLALSDIIYSTVITPKIIQTYLFGYNSIQFHMCFLQMYFLHFAGSVDSYIMLVMAIDRYISICYPLRYPALITNRNAQKMCFTAWMLGAITPLTPVIQALVLPFCGSNMIPLLYCEIGTVVRLASIDTTFNQQMGSSFGNLVLIALFLLILLSYLKIIVSVMKIATSGNRMKAAYTCSTQIIVIFIYFLPRLFVYIASTAGLFIPGDLRVSLGVLYCLLPPLVNPLIYSFRTKEIKQFILKQLNTRNIYVKRKKATCMRCF
ncbi:olfactory receptor 10G7-like [Erpetoichthys calabaricus]|uniref:olfactory receptor 10G7-like n=1 Tax=Erpetoichthys calabaricus TaxID=27687 RepID=UPI0010A097CD|nr:olfactory receptor 10G7-like [Erpetoichthys calabaricus]